MGTDTVDTVLDAKTARAILAEVAEGGWLDKDLPEDENDLIDLAEYYVMEAKQWVEDGNPPDRHLNAIINLAKASPPVISEIADNTNDGIPPGEIDLEQEPDDVWTRGTGKPLTYPNSRQESTEYEGLPIPSPLPEAAPLTMPTDLTDVGDKRLRMLYSAFTSYWGRARWQLGVATSNLANATHLRDDTFRSHYNKIQRQALADGEKVAQGTLENLAKDTDGYRNWDEKVTEHEREVIDWRALADIFSKNVEVLSREWTMRTEQYERER